MYDQGGIRLRRGVAVEESKESLTSKLAKKLKTFDYYGKVHDDYTVRTQSGGLISLVSWAAVFLLLVFQLRAFLSVEVVDHVRIDTHTGQNLSIELNVSFPNIRCEFISVDTVDSVGEHQVDVQGEILKTPVDSDGVGHHADHTAREGECGSCFGAETDSRKCCNTCMELQEAWGEKGWSKYDVIAIAPQCKEGRGCNVAGKVTVNKIGGNVHVALGKSQVRDGKHIHEFNVQDVTSGFNTSHVIHTLKFGETVPQTESPLEGVRKSVQAGTAMFCYFIKLVPTEFVWLSGKRTFSNQYSVTETERNVKVIKERLTGLPGVFFVYDFNPFLIQKEERRGMQFHQFIISVVAIVGGVFTISSMVDSLFYKGARQLSIVKVS